MDLMKQEHKTRLSFRGLVSTFSAVLVSAGVLSSTSAQSENFQLEEVIVTATKRAENIQDVSATVRALSGDYLESLDVKSIADVINLMPNIQIKGSPSEEITVRGIAQSRLGQSPVARHVNGMYKYDHWAYLGVMYDIDSVEVIQGPTGTQYGRNATAGAINVIQKKPISEFEAFADFGVGNYDQRQMRAVVNVPFFGEGDETLMGRFVFEREVRDGFIENVNPGSGEDEDFNQADDTFIRASLRSIFDEDSELTVRGYWYERANDYEGAQLDLEEYPVGVFSSAYGDYLFDPFDGMQLFLSEYANRTVGLNGNTNSGPALTDTLFAGGAGGFATREEAAKFGILNGYFPNAAGKPFLPPLIVDEVFFDAALPVTGDLRKVPSAVSEVGDPHWRVSGLDGEYVKSFSGLGALGDFRLNVLAGWERISRVQATENDATNLKLIDTRTDFDADTYNSEVRLTSENDGNLEWITGVFWFKRNFNEQRVALLSFLEFLDTRRDTVEEGFGIYINNAYHITDAWEVSAGIRWNKDIIEAKLSETSKVATFDPTIVEIPEQKLEFIERTGQIGTKYRFTEDHMAYLTFTKGYKPGGLELVAAIAETRPLEEAINLIEPELIDAWEVGLKTEWMDRRLRLNMAAFYYDYTDLQVPVISGLSEETFNAGEATIWGVEMDMTYLITPEWKVMVSAGRLEATFDEFCLVDPYQSVQYAVANTSPLGSGGGIAQLPTEPGCDFVDNVPSAPSTLNLEGNTLEDAPDWKVAFYTSYDLDLGDKGSLKSVLQVTWTDDYYLRPTNVDEIDLVEAYTLTDVRFIWKSPKEKYTIEAFVKNLEDKTVKNRVVVLPEIFGGIPTAYGINPPRTYGVRFGYNFGI